MTMIQTQLMQLQAGLGERLAHHDVHCDQITIEILPVHLREVCLLLRGEPFHFDVLVDVCGIDYSTYGTDEWKKNRATLSGFSRGVMGHPQKMEAELVPDARFAVTYHFLSIKKNERLRMRVFIDKDPPMIDSIVDIWASANWYEREAFDLYGILFLNHPDLRRILTDYGFIGHPFRKDFPLIGNVEMRYDAATERCIYEPVVLDHEP